MACPLRRLRQSAFGLPELSQLLEVVQTPRAKGSVGAAKGPSSSKGRAGVLEDAKLRSDPHGW